MFPDDLLLVAVMLVLAWANARFEAVTSFRRNGFAFKLRGGDDQTSRV